MRDGFIRLGDPTTSGGKVVQASGFPSDGIPTALEDDKASCPLHGGDFPIVGGYAFFKQSGRNTATEQLSKLACGCGLISTTAPSLARVEQTPSHGSNASAARAAERFAEPTKGGMETGQFDEHFIFVDAVTGDPLRGLTCLLIPEVGLPQQCALDDRGRTERHRTAAPIPISVAISAPAPAEE